MTDRPTDLSFGPYWGNFKWPYLREGSSDPLHVWFYGGVFSVGGSNGANSFLTKLNRYVGENNARGVTIGHNLKYLFFVQSHSLDDVFRSQ